MKPALVRNRRLDRSRLPVARIGQCVIVLVLAAALLTGCAGLGPTETAAVAVGAVTLATVSGGFSPNNEIEQIYYLGVFDEQDQLPPTVYRVRVRGQASFISQMKFGSGWVHASVLDALGSSVSFEKGGGQLTIEKTDTDFKPFPTGRRLMLFGPEGFRRAPADHRLVIVMGSSPEEFFNAIDESLGVVAQATQERGSVELDRLLFEALVTARAERAQVDQVTRDFNELPR